MLSGLKPAFPVTQKRLSESLGQKVSCFAKADLGQWVGQPNLPVRELGTLVAPK